MSANDLAMGDVATEACRSQYIPFSSGCQLNHHFWGTSLFRNMSYLVIRRVNWDELGHR